MPKKTPAAKKKKKAGPKKSAKRTIEKPDPAPEGRRGPHHDDRDFNPMAQRDYRDHEGQKPDPRVTG